MTAKMLLESAAANLGYKKNDDLLRSGVVFINQVCADLARPFGTAFIPVRSLSDRLCLPDDVIDGIAVYGVAMYIALYRGDGEKNQLFASLYNQKRRLLSKSQKRRDVLPRGEG